MSSMILKTPSSAAARAHKPGLQYLPALPSSLQVAYFGTSCKRALRSQGRFTSSPSRSDTLVVCGAQPASSAPTASPGLGLFPSGAQQARVQLPAVVLQVEVSDVLGDSAMPVFISQALQGGCNMVVLWDSQSNAAAMYDAALRVQDLLRGRAALLLVDRTDIALAIGAQGVVLTDQGVPTVVARRMLSASGSNPGQPGSGGSGALVGRLVADEAAAVTAAADGASLLLVTGPGGTAPSPALLSAAKSGQRSGNAIPVIMSVRVTSSGSSGPSGLTAPGSSSNGTEGGDGAGSSSSSSSSGQQSAAAAAALHAEVDGVAVSPEALPGVARACFDLPETSSVADLTTALLTRLNVKAATAGTSTRNVQPSTAASPTSSSSPPPPSTAASDHQPTPASASSSSPAPSPQLPPQQEPSAAAGPPAAAGAAPVPPPAVSPATPPAVTPPRPAAPSAAPPAPLRRLLGPAQEALLAAEQAALGRVLGFLEQTLPGVSELSLLRDALKSLDEPFLVAVVGEFNSGKSSVINALLGRRYLAEGILPTTNEISILKYAQPQGTEAPASPSSAPASSSAWLGPRLEQQADGLYVRYLPARLLQDLHIVDTPGTNVILERQQRLTEEYVPRADLVVFVMSADRPFSESEVRFLEYIRQWRKRVLFVVNKADLLAGQEEVAQVADFVADNARRILRLDRPDVVAVSSRLALRAKLHAAGLPSAAAATAPPSTVSEYTLDYYTSVAPASTPAAASPSSFLSPDSSSASSSSVLSLPPEPFSSLSSAEGEEAEAALRGSPLWAASGFGALEAQVANYLVGKGFSSGDGAGAGSGGEGVRLKLQTPLFVADALLGAAGRQLAAELAAARAELEAVVLVGRQLAQFRAEMEADAAAQRAALQQICSEVVGRAERFVDGAVQLSNAPLLLSAAAGSKEYPFRASFEREVVGGGLEQLRGAVAEHGAWLRANCTAQRAYYSAFAAARGSATAATGTAGNAAAAAEEGAAALAASPSPSTSAAAPYSVASASFSPGSAVASSSSSSSPASSPALKAVSEFNIRALSTLIDGELQQAMASTAGTAVGAPLVGLFAIQAIPNTLEDLLLGGVAGLVSYVALLNLPLRRADIKAKISRVASNFVADVAAQMAAEVEAELGGVEQAVGCLVAPLQAACGAEVGRLEARQAQLAAHAEELQELQRRVANLE